MLTTTWRSPNVSIAGVDQSLRRRPSRRTLSPLAIASPPMPLISSTTCCAGRGVAAGAVDVAAEIVDHDLGAVPGEAECVLPTDATPCAGDDRDASFSNTN